MRLFLALEIPPPVREELAAFQSGLQDNLPGWRWVRPEGLHLTLRFLGDVATERDAGIRESWCEVAARAEPVRFELRGIGTFPDSRRPRVLWVGVEEVGDRDSLRTLAEMLEHAARELGFSPEPRPFHAHLTLARAGSGRAMPPQETFTARSEILAHELVLFQSRLEATGARYTALARYPLGSNPASCMSRHSLGSK